MATGNYGVIRPSDVTPDDVEIFYHYTPSRDVIGNQNLNKLDPNDVLFKINNPLLFLYSSNIVHIKPFSVIKKSLTAFINPSLVLGILRTTTDKLSYNCSSIKP